MLQSLHNQHKQPLVHLQSGDYNRKQFSIYGQVALHELKQITIGRKTILQRTPTHITSIIFLKSIQTANMNIGKVQSMI